MSTNARLLRTGSITSQNRRQRPRRAADQSVSEQVARLAAIERAQSVIELNLDGKIAAANDKLLHALGYKFEELTGCRLSDIVDPACNENAHFDQIWAQLARGECASGRFRILGKAGTSMWVDGAFSAVLDRGVGRVPRS